MQNFGLENLIKNSGVDEGILLNYYTLGGYGVNLFYGEWGRVMGCYDYCNEHLGFRKERDICPGPKPLSHSEEGSGIIRLLNSP